MACVRLRKCLTDNYCFRSKRRTKATPGARVGIRATVSVPGNRNPSTTLSKTYSQRKQSDISLDHIFKIKSPLGARDGTVVDWRRTKGRLTIETVEIEEDNMNGGEKNHSHRRLYSHSAGIGRQ